MNSSLMMVTVQSPEDLRRSLGDLLKADPKKNRFVSISLTDPSVLGYPFEFESVSAKDVNTKLLLEAVGLLSLPADEIVLDYQILKNEGNQLKGIFICMPKRLLNEYLKEVYQAGLIPLKMTTAMLSCIDAFMTQQGRRQERLCLIDLYQNNVIHIAIFHQGQCELLRDIHYESLDEAWQELRQSFRCVTAKSVDKQCSHIYVGDAVEEELVKKLAEDFAQTPETINLNSIGVPKTTESFLTLNLIRHHGLSLKERQNILLGLKTLTIIAFIACGFLTFNVWHSKKETETLRDSYTKTDYDHAQQLTERIQLLKL